VPETPPRPSAAHHAAGADGDASWAKRTGFHDVMTAHCRNAKFAASTNAHARYALPFRVLHSPFFLPLLCRTLSTQRQYELNWPTAANRATVPVSSMITVASISPMSGSHSRRGGRIASRGFVEGPVEEARIHEGALIGC